MEGVGGRDGANKRAESVGRCDHLYSVHWEGRTREDDALSRGSLSVAEDAFSEGASADFSATRGQGAVGGGIDGREDCFEGYAAREGAAGDGEAHISTVALSRRGSDGGDRGHRLASAVEVRIERNRAAERVVQEVDHRDDLIAIEVHGEASKGRAKASVGEVGALLAVLEVAIADK